MPKIFAKKGKSDASSVNSNDGLQPKITQLEAQVTQLEAQTIDLNEKLRIALSDYQNLKRDIDKRVESERIIVLSSLLRKIVDLVDDMNMASEQFSCGEDWQKGFNLIRDKARNLSLELGAQEIPCASGDTFDPATHEAVGVVPVTNNASVQKDQAGKSSKVGVAGKAGTISQVMQKGYRMGDIVVRPVRVTVFK